MSDLIKNNLINDIKVLLHSARNSIYQTINATMTQTYWEIGKRIVEEEQGGEKRAQYGKAFIKNLSMELTKEFGKGFSADNIKSMRRFYIAYQKSETVSNQFKLSYSHYIFLTRMKNFDERNFYEIEDLVEMTLPKDNNQIYASKYLTILPNKEEFQRLLESEDE